MIVGFVGIGDSQNCLCYTESFTPFIQDRKTVRKDKSVKKVLRRFKNKGGQNCGKRV